MEIWESILIIVCLWIVLPIMFSIFSFSKMRAEKKLKTEDAVRTSPPKALSAFFLGFALLVLCGGIAGMIYLCIAKKEDMTTMAVVAMPIVIAGLSFIGFFGYAYVRFNYVVADESGVHVYRLFKKKQYYSYEEIGCFQDTIALGMFGGFLFGFDKNHNKIFKVEAISVGASQVAQRLREHGVAEEKRMPPLNPPLK